MSDKRSKEKRPAPRALADFIALCGGAELVAKVSERHPYAVRRQGKQGNWPRSRKVLQALSDAFGVEWREEWLDEIEPRLDVLEQHAQEASRPKKSRPQADQGCAA